MVVEGEVEDVEEGGEEVGTTVVGDGAEVVDVEVDGGEATVEGEEQDHMIFLWIRLLNWAKSPTSP